MRHEECRDFKSFLKTRSRTKFPVVNYARDTVSQFCSRSRIIPTSAKFRHLSITLNTIIRSDLLYSSICTQARSSPPLSIQTRAQYYSLRLYSNLGRLFWKIARNARSILRGWSSPLIRSLHPSYTHSFIYSAAAVALWSVVSYHHWACERCPHNNVSDLPYVNRLLINGTVRRTYDRPDFVHRRTVRIETQWS